MVRKRRQNGKLVRTRKGSLFSLSPGGISITDSFLNNSIVAWQRIHFGALANVKGIEAKIKMNLVVGSQKLILIHVECVGCYQEI
ncbi:MAG: hypothetical protein ACYDAO_03000 [Thermoplasmataceae archaeon]